MILEIIIAVTPVIENRDEFQRLIRDCKDGKIDLIIVKAISRFARNTVTLLETVRMLKSVDVDVCFEVNGKDRWRGCACYGARQSLAA